MHSGRINKKTGKAYSPKHNDRNYDGKAANIVQEKTPANIVWKWSDVKEETKNLTIEESELLFYTTNYSKQLEETNKKYDEQRHPERKKTMEKWKMQKIHAPEEIIFQIGKAGERPDIELFKRCIFRYITELGAWNKEHGDHMHILSYSLHQDEQGAPHVQLRRVWDYDNMETGRKEIGQEKALEASGITLPYPDKEIGRYNNRKIAFDTMMRKKWQDIAKENGLEIETTPKDPSEVGLTLDEYIRHQEIERSKKSKDLENEINNLEKDKLNFSDIKRQAEELLSQKEEINANKKKSEELQAQVEKDKEAVKAESDKEKQKDKEVNEYLDKNKITQKSHLILDIKIFKEEELPKPLLSETKKQYTIKVLNLFKETVEERIEGFKKTYIKLFDCIKSLYLENKDLKKTMAQKIEAAVKEKTKDLQSKIKDLIENHEKEKQILTEAAYKDVEMKNSYGTVIGYKKTLYSQLYNEEKEKFKNYNNLSPDQLRELAAKKERNSIKPSCHSR